MPFFASPTQIPAYTCGTEISVLDLDDDSAFISTLNPTASEFVPSFYPMVDDSDEARRVDDILRTMHHLVSVSDSEHLSYAQQFADADFPIDDTTASYLDAEDAMCGGLHFSAQKPKGNTYGRKREGPRRNRSREARRSGN